VTADLIAHGNRREGPPPVPEKVRRAAEIMAVTPGPIDYAALARSVGYSNAHMLRRALALPQNIRYLRAHKRAMVEEINMGNPERLRRIADAQGGNQMAKVAAVRGLELMQNDGEALSRDRGVKSPGVTIVIEAPSALNPPVVDVTPEPAPEFEDM